MEFKEEYWNNALEILEQEEAWQEALEVLEVEEAWADAMPILKKSERLVLAKRWTPVLALLVISSVLFFSLPKDTATANIYKNIELSVNLGSAKFYHQENTEINSGGTAQITEGIYSKLIDKKGTVKNFTANIDELKGKGSVNEKSLVSTKSNQEIISTQDKGILPNENSISDIEPTENNIPLTTNKPTRLDRSLDFAPMIHLPFILVKAELNMRYSNQKRIFSARRDQFELVIGTSQLTGYGTDGEVHLNQEIGIEYDKNINANSSLSLGLSYYSIEGVHHSATFSETQYGFGSVQTDRTFVSNKLNYAYLPLQFNYHFDHKHTLSVGVGLSYLLNNRSAVQKSILTNGEITHSEEKTLRGYMDGYYRLNGSIMAGYEFKLNPKMSFSLQYQYGLNKITLEEIYGQFEADRNSRLRAALKIRVK